jgi:hypothetical protein
VDGLAPRFAATLQHAVGACEASCRRSFLRRRCCDSSLRLSLVPSASLTMSQPPTPAIASSVLFACVQYDGALGALLPLREAMARVSSKSEGLLWAKHFGEFMVRRLFISPSPRVLTVFIEGTQGLCGDCGPGCWGRYPASRYGRLRVRGAQLLRHGGVD